MTDQKIRLLVDAMVDEIHKDDPTFIKTPSHVISTAMAMAQTAAQASQTHACPVVRSLPVSGEQSTRKARREAKQTEARERKKAANRARVREMLAEREKMRESGGSGH